MTTSARSDDAPELPLTTPAPETADAVDTAEPADAATPTASSDPLAPEVAAPAAPAESAVPPVPPTYGYAGAETAAPATASPAEDAAKARRGTVLTFWAGVAVLIIGGGSALLASNRGGVVWTGGLIFGAILLVRSLASYRASRAAGAAALGTAGWVVTGVALAASAGIGLAGLASFIGAKASEPTEAETTGSCWHVEDESSMLQVACDSDHEFIAISEVGDVQECSLEATAYVELDSTYLCLADD